MVDAARAPRVVAAVFGLLLVAGLALAWAGSALPVTAAAPRGAPSPVPGSGAGPALVEYSADTATHPHAAGVLAQLQRHFDAINARDYAAWRDTVVAARSDPLPEQEWRAAYASTVDGSIRIDRIDDVPGGGVLVRVRFISTQDTIDAPGNLPLGRLCWRSTLPMTIPADGTLPRIDLTGSGSSTAQAC